MDTSNYDKIIQRSIKHTLTPHDYLAIESTFTKDIKPHLKSNIDSPLYGFHLRTNFINVSAIHFLAKSFVIYFEEYSFLNERHHVTNYLNALKLFTGSHLDVDNKIIWNHNYEHGSHLDAIRQLYYVFYMLMYEGIISYNKDRYEAKKQFKSQIIKKILNAFKLENSEFPDYSVIDNSIRVKYDEKSEIKNELNKVVIPLYPKEPDFEKLTYLFIRNNISNMEKIF